MKIIFFASLAALNVGFAIAQEGLFIETLPDQPSEESWHFIDDLKSPLWSDHGWKSTSKSTPIASDQADLSQGVSIQADFPDPKERLKTAYTDLRKFFDAGDVSHEKGDYVITTKKVDDLEGEAFRVEVKSKGCDLYAGDVEGIRRGVFHIEDEMRRLRAARLPLGTVKKKPVVLRRISRCFFGPIKRPPKMTDELLDDVNYYPDQYLNRLAHEGVNGLWLTIEFRDLVKTKYTPDAAPDAEQRLAKLKRTVDACLRYGIRTYIFCIEPRRWTKGSQPDPAYPELIGGKYYGGNFVCPSSPAGHDFLYQSVNTIFKTIPDLGGIINITHGERGTTCLSSVPSTDDFKDKIKCPRCAKKQPWEILHASLSAMEEGMHDAAPEAELISWLYMPQTQRWGQRAYCGLADWVFDVPTHTPQGVVFQFNFETGVRREFFGKEMFGGDYWISTPGPSPRFERVASIAREQGTQVSAKIQTGNSHEVATTPYIPVPSLLYRKFAAMHRLGVSHTMLCWYFGSYPGMMNKAAGLLSMEPFPQDEHAFLVQLASIDWKANDVVKVVQAWEHFTEGFENYPLTNEFQYYGPIHDGPVWPLLFKPLDAPLSPTWQIGSSSTLKSWPPSGDRIGECIGATFSVEEVVQLTGRMTQAWDEGLKLLNEIEPNYVDEPQRLLDIGIAKALGIQFRSGHNILRFYHLREKMFRMQGSERLVLLQQMSDIVRDEIAGDQELLLLCEKDSRLGFHSEAEGYKYFPAKIRWRMTQLKHVLENDVPELEKIIASGEPLFPEYTGAKPEGPVAHCPVTSSVTFSAVATQPSSPASDSPSDSPWLPPEGLSWQTCTFRSSGDSARWASQRDPEALTLWVSEDQGPVVRLEVKVEVHRLHPCHRYAFSWGKETSAKYFVRRGSKSGKSYAIVRIPWSELGMSADDFHPIRLDVKVHQSDGRIHSWLPSNPLTPRLRLFRDNPADLGWLLFDQ